MTEYIELITAVVIATTIAVEAINTLIEKSELLASSLRGLLIHGVKRKPKARVPEGKDRST